MSISCTSVNILIYMNGYHRYNMSHLNFPKCLHPQTQDAEMWVLPAEGNTLWIGTAMADMGNVSGLQGRGEPEWTNWNTAGENNFSRILLLAVGHSKYKGGVAPPCVNLKVVQPTLRRGALWKGAFLFFTLSPHSLFHLQTPWHLQAP